MSTPSRSSTGRGPLIAATLIVVSVVVIILILAARGATPASIWQSFFPPPPATDQAREISDLYDLVFYIAVAIFLVVEIVIVFTVFRYRRKPGDDELPPQTHGNNLVEIIWTVIPTVIVAVPVLLLVAEPEQGRRRLRGGRPSRSARSPRASSGSSTTSTRRRRTRASTSSCSRSSCPSARAAGWSCPWARRSR